MTALTVSDDAPAAFRRAPKRSAARSVAAGAGDIASRAFAVLTPLGRVTAGAGALAWLIGWRLGWNEFMLAAATCAVLLLVAVAFTVGRLDVDVAIAMSPPRVVVGQTARGQLSAVNASHKRLLGLRVELLVGNGVAQFDIPNLGPEQSHDELFAIPTHRRAVIPIGPTRTLRGDPLGLLRRTLSWPDATNLYVHPRTTRLDGLGAGYLRDLEGRTTNDSSTSDVELQTLRDYVPGDDRRYVHWRTSARSGRLMVVQFVDTRRSHIVLLQSGDDAEYASEEEFELGVSVLASLAIRGVRDQQSLGIVAAGRAINTSSVTSVLDGTSGIELAGPRTGLEAAAADARRRNADLTLAVLIAGSTASVTSLRAAAWRLGQDVNAVVFRVDPGATSAVRDIGPALVMTVGALGDLPRLARAATHA
ncbi:MAG: DUF58 domain-containing protein [Mycobacteriales bacterium]